MLTSEVVRKYLDSIGRRAEAEYYLALFRAERPESFAILAVDSVTMRHAADALAVDLRFLAELGLFPVIALGLVEPGEAAAHARLIAEWLAGDVACKVVAAADAGATTREGTLALVPFGDLPGAAGEDARFDRLADLAASVGTRKLLFLGRRGGLKPHGRARLQMVDLTTEYDELMAPGTLSRAQGALLRQIKRVLDRVPHRLTASVTSPLQLLRELFTVRGAGTLVRRGAAIERHSSYATIDRRRLDAAIRSAFGRSAGEAFYERPVERIYVTEAYRGAAIVASTPLGPYLSKFAVDRRSQGEGFGRDLWRALGDDYPSLFWRSRPANPITPWYHQQCDGMQRIEGWVVFWRGLPVDKIAAAIAYARDAPDDFRPR
jgi:hypothetical protein